jgi:purine-binding chemotaxis protein CheW
MENIMEQFEEFEDVEFPWLIFKIKENLYTVNSKIINTIVKMPEKITQVPNVPKYIKGLIHLRGSVIPLIDLKILLKTKIELSDSKEMIVVLENENCTVGIIVDEVLSVDNIIPFEETEEILKICKDKYVSGVAKSEKGNEILLILDEEKIMNSSEI